MDPEFCLSSLKNKFIKKHWRGKALVRCDPQSFAVNKIAIKNLCFTLIFVQESKGNSDPECQSISQLSHMGQPLPEV